MKLLVQSDDYGITEAQARGAIQAITEGIVRNTGLFSNMPWAPRCVEWIRPYLDQIAFGLDLNMSTGPALLSRQEIPSLVQENGQFLTSSMNRALDTDENDHDHVVYEEAYREFEAQILRFIELVGRKPDYLHGHAYGTKTTSRVSRDLAAKYGLPYSMAIGEDPRMTSGGMGWYQFPPTLENQLKSDLTDFILKDQNGYLGKEYGMLITHCGYVEACLFGLSSFTLYRAKDLEGVTDEKVKQWVKDNQVELITYKDLEGWY
ncbi:MAG: ChbG/HpnK family deacetylase [Lachnospiraceae bacterium]|nr:ChbG/HpnK family deacetylase [Lachnospiraceae bacterium]